MQAGESLNVAMAGTVAVRAARRGGQRACAERPRTRIARRGVLALVARRKTLDDLDEAERQYLGKSSPLNEIREAIKSVDRPSGRRRQAARGRGRARRRTALARAGAALQASKAAIARSLDLTLPGRVHARHLHPVTRASGASSKTCSSGIGYKVAEGPEVELDWYNFEALNFPPGIPRARCRTRSTSASASREKVLLRTHTSPVQVRVMESQRPPIYVVAPGRVFRRDTLDARHSPVFHQIEGWPSTRDHARRSARHDRGVHPRAVRPDISARFLPSFFPFTEPSVEFAMSCVFCRARVHGVLATGWIELGGAGMVDPNVFDAVGIDPEEYTGFAFGFGIDRSCSCSTASTT
jgi:phenylalanyl-tRNA synthetase alpha chain